MSLPEFIYTSLLRPKPLKKLANTLIRRIVPAQVFVAGATVVLNPNDPVISGALTFGVYEKPETAFFCAACKSGMTFLDIGANVGYYTALAIVRIGNGKIVALEPDPENFKYLQATVAANHAGNVTCVQQAAAEEPGVGTLYQSSGNRGDHRLYPNNLSDAALQVEVCSVDSLLPGLGIRSVDLIKVDVQGFEGHVLEGMRETIRRSPNVTVMIEFWPFGLRSAGTSPEDFLAELEERKLRPYVLTGKGNLAPVKDKQSLILRHSGRRYTNLILFGGNAAPPPGFED